MGKIIGGTTSTTMRVPKWELFADVTLSADEQWHDITLDKPYKEVYVEGAFVISTTASAKTIYMRVGNGTTVIAVTGAVSSAANGDTVYYRANGKIAPSGKYVFESAAAKSVNTANVTINCGDADSSVVDSFDGMNMRLRTSDHTNFLLGAGSTIKVWGR